jgi:hypothetical protein
VDQVLLQSATPAKQGMGKLHSRRLGRAVAHATRPRFLIQKLLHDLDDERHLFCPLTVVKTNHGKPTMGRRLESSVTTVVVTFDGTSALEMAWAAAVMAGGPPPSDGLSREASALWFDGAAVKGQGRLSLTLLGVTGDGFYRGRALARGTWTHDRFYLKIKIEAMIPVTIWQRV